MTRFLKFLKPYKKEMTIAPLTKFLEALFEIVLPILMAMLIDDGIKGGDKSIIYTLSIIMFCLVLVGTACSLFCQYTASVVGAKFAKDLRNELFSKLIRSDERARQHLSSTEMVNRWTSDVTTVSHAVALTIRLVLRAPILGFGAIIACFILDPVLGAIVAAFFPIVLFIGFLIMRISIKKYREAAKSLDELTVVAKENVRGVHIIRAFTREEDELRRFTKLNAKWQRVETSTERVAKLLTPSVALLMNIAAVLVLSVGAFRIEAGFLSAGKLIAFINYIAQVSLSIVMVTNLSLIFTRANVAATRINQALDCPEIELRTGEGVDESAPVMEFLGASYGFNDALVLSDINLRVEKGLSVGIIGSTGGGKTTLIKLMMGLYEGQGSVRIFGRDTKEWNKSALLKLFGYAPQNASILSGTIRSNLLMGKPDASEQEMEEAIFLAGLSGFIERSEDGLNTVVNENGNNLSGGQRQRLAMARAFIRKPRILVLDDTFSALDTKTQNKIKQNLGALKPDATIIVSERIKSISDMDKIFVLDKGRVMGGGTHSELLKSCDIYREIALSQNEEI